jgi:sensor histidine kinase YesM
VPEGWIISFFITLEVKWFIFICMTPFTDNNLIFSNEWKYRIRRHILFWLCFWVYFAVTHAANPFGGKEIAYFNNPIYTLSESVLFMIGQMPLVYIMLYFILPALLLKKKYVLGIFAIVLLWFFGGVMTFYLFREVYPKVISMFFPVHLIPNEQRPPSVSFFQTVIFMNKGVFTVTAGAFVIKFAKFWYLKEQRNLQLQKENTAAQMQLLTAQIHPHFLFNTLNNIFSQTQTESPRGSKMIMGLSDMLRYILYEGQKPLVLLKQELLMTTEYINLEKIRYGNKLDVHVLTPDRADNIYIAPLLLLPFVENCFKHGASNMLQNPWINLTIELKDTTLVMKLMNGKTPSNENIERKQGIGISNVSQRLNLLYKDKYDLQIREDEEVFVVDLRVELMRIRNKEQDGTPVQSRQEAIYG